MNKGYSTPSKKYQKENYSIWSNKWYSLFGPQLSNFLPTTFFLTSDIPWYPTGRVTSNASKLSVFGRGLARTVSLTVQGLEIGWGIKGRDGWRLTTSSDWVLKRNSIAILIKCCRKYFLNSWNKENKTIIVQIQILDEQLPSSNIRVNIKPCLRMSQQFENNSLQHCPAQNVTFSLLHTFGFMVKSGHNWNLDLANILSGKFNRNFVFLPWLQSDFRI